MWRLSIVEPPICKICNTTQIVPAWHKRYPSFPAALHWYCPSCKWWYRQLWSDEREAFKEVATPIG